MSADGKFLALDTLTFDFCIGLRDAEVVCGEFFYALPIVPIFVLTDPPLGFQIA